MPSYGFWPGDISQPPPDTQGPLRPFSDKAATVQLLIAADPLGFMWHHSDTLSRLGVVTFSDIRRLTVHNLTAAAMPRLDALRIMFARRLFDSDLARLHGEDIQVGDTVNSRLRNYHYLGFLMPVSQPLHASQSYYNRSCLVRLGGLEVPPVRRAPIDLSQTLPFPAQFLYLGEWIVVNVLATSPLLRKRRREFASRSAVVLSAHYQATTWPRGFAPALLSARSASRSPPPAAAVSSSCACPSPLYGALLAGRWVLRPSGRHPLPRRRPANLSACAPRVIFPLSAQPGT